MIGRKGLRNRIIKMLQYIKIAGHRYESQEYKNRLPIKLCEVKTVLNATEMQATQDLADDIAKLLLCPMVLPLLLKRSNQHHRFQFWLPRTAVLLYFAFEEDASSVHYSW